MFQILFWFCCKLLVLLTFTVLYQSRLRDLLLWDLVSQISNTNYNFCGVVDATLTVTVHQAVT